MVRDLKCLSLHHLNKQSDEVDAHRSEKERVSVGQIHESRLDLVVNHVCESDGATKKGGG